MQPHSQFYQNTSHPPHLRPLEETNGQGIPPKTNSGRVLWLAPSQWYFPSPACQGAQPGDQEKPVLEESGGQSPMGALRFAFHSPGTPQGNSPVSNLSLSRDGVKPESLTQRQHWLDFSRSQACCLCLVLAQPAGEHLPPRWAPPLEDALWGNRQQVGLQESR